MTDVSSNPVLLVHGFASSFHLNWQEPGLSYLLEDAGREVIGVDLLGHGDAPRPHEPAAYADLGARVVDVLPDDGRQVDAVGFSMGARTLIEVVAAHPDRFARLVLAGVGENLFQSGDKESLARAIEFGDGGPGGIASVFVSFAQGSGNDPKALAACMRRDEPPITEDQLARITCPTLVILGDKDFVGSADRLVSLLPDAELRLLKNVEHFATPKDFGFIDATLEFLGAVPA